MGAGCSRHELLLYSGADGFVSETMPFIGAALATASPVMVAATAERIDALRETLAADAERVLLLDMRELGRNPARIMPAWSDFLAERCGDGSGALGITEAVWPGRSAAELSECMRHEHLMSERFDCAHSWHLLCPYDLDALDDEVIETAIAAHPFLTRSGARRGGPEHLGAEPPRRSPFAGALPAPAACAARQMRFTLGELSLLRELVIDRATAERMDAERAQELVLAVNELATNSVSYGGGAGTLELWRENGALVCEVRDTGHIEDPLVGRVRPEPSSSGGWGLWLAHQLCDLVQVRSAPGATAVRVHKRLS